MSASSQDLVSPDSLNWALTHVLRFGENVGPARYLLRRATALRTRIILTDVLANIEFFLPILRDVANYLVQVYDKKKPDQIGEVLLRLVNNSSYRHLPYVEYWVLAMFSEVPAFCDANTAIG